MARSGVVFVCLLLVPAMAGCLVPGDDVSYGGEKVISGWVFESRGFHPAESGAVGTLYLATTSVNGITGGMPEGCFMVTLQVWSEILPIDFQQIQALAAENGRVRDVFLEFRGATEWPPTIAHAPTDTEDMEMVELIRLVEAPAGLEWARSECGVPDDWSRETAGP